MENGRFRGTQVALCGPGRLDDAPARRPGAGRNSTARRGGRTPDVAYSAAFLLGIFGSFEIHQSRKWRRPVFSRASISLLVGLSAFHFLPIDLAAAGLVLLGPWC